MYPTKPFIISSQKKKNNIGFERNNSYQNSNFSQVFIQETTFSTMLNMVQSINHQNIANLNRFGYLRWITHSDTVTRTHMCFKVKKQETNFTSE